MKEPEEYRFLAKKEWPLGADGIPTRQAARVIIISEDGYALLMLGHDSNDVNYRWWFTVGGGIKAGETALEAAQRELLEETGYEAKPHEVVGPVVERDGLFKFVDRPRRQIEYMFLVRTERFEVDSSRWTTSEKSLIDDLRWVPISEIEELSKEAFIYPPELTEIISTLYSNRWDGECVKIDEYNENGA
ncbi:NUDIX domain-containing protein [Gleimia sp. 6138-11-ORH1]|uniref:NUDIX hydrolase n=1 Tax=Gleimia sp. 6138-11-ORH1 TaxID=2973937 RepID=UPI0021670214|nr:NUDIX domain-containing protein [Gleimia sp. 6138-11-ORH1]MCS4484416.1 NUDIX domain-containing protein [Gleimia sp. 6138-11-ORH1]